ncbi:MAG: DsrE/DsrF/DrsH-like family protein [Rhodospirillales bacterium]|nr:DsrE/DsrF/DrsH-like family protein [Rhodospirillales bacterium]
MPADRPRHAPPDKLSVVAFSGMFDQVHYAVVVATAAAAVGRPVTLFFTMGALRALLRPGEDGIAPWRAMAVSEGAGDGDAMDASFAASGVATFEQLLGAAAELGVRLMVCEMGLRALGLGRESLRPDLNVEEGGVVSFLNDASRHGAVIFV